jgi:hypothetical protein
MTGSLILLAVLAAILLIALPAISGLAYGRSGPLAAPFYLVLMTGLFAYHFGLSAGARLPPASQSGQPPPGLCRQLIDQSRQAGLLGGRAEDGTVRVSGALWQELPEQGREAIRACLDQTRPAAERGRPVNIVESGS